MLLSKKTQFSIMLFFVLGACGQLQAENSNLCPKSDESLFSCGLDNAKIVSICTAKESKANYIEYKYGTKSKVELTYRADENNPKNIFHRAEVAYASNTEDTIWFKNGPFTYVIFMPARGTPGIEVSRNKEVISRHECSGGWRDAVRGERKDSPFIVDHGKGDVSKFEELW